MTIYFNLHPFQAYLDDSRVSLLKAQTTFKSMPNPKNVAGIAANLYHCLNHMEDALEELERFTFCYDDSYLSTGRELFRISSRLRSEAQASLRSL